MTLRGGFFNSVGGDRVYDATDFSRYFKELITDGCLPELDGLLVYENTAPVGSFPTVMIKAGLAFCNGLWAELDADYIFTIDTQMRADANWIYLISLCFDTVARTVSFHSVGGLSPAWPDDSGAGGKYYVHLAQVLNKVGDNPDTFGDERNAAGVASYGMDTPNIVNGAITTPKISDSAVTLSKIDPAARVKQDSRQTLAASVTLTNKISDIFTLLNHSKTYAHKLLLCGVIRGSWADASNNISYLYLRDSTTAYSNTAIPGGTPAGAFFQEGSMSATTGTLHLPFYYVVSCAANVTYNFRASVAATDGSVGLTLVGSAADTTARCYMEVIELPG